MFINKKQLTYEHPLYTLFQSFYIGWIRGMLVYDNPLAPCTRLVAQFNQTQAHYIMWIWMVSHFWRYVKLKWATIIGVKGDLCKYVASQSHVYEGKATRFVIFLFMWPRPLVEMVGFIISKPKSCLRLFMDCVRVVHTCVPYSHANRKWQTYTLSFYLALFNFINGLQEAIPHTMTAITKHSVVVYSWWDFK